MKLKRFNFNKQLTCFLDEVRMEKNSHRMKKNIHPMTMLLFAESSEEQIHQRDSAKKYLIFYFTRIPPQR